MEKNRYSDWIESSMGLMQVEMLLINDTQGLGMIDVELIKEFTELKLDSKVEDDLLRKYKHIFLSKLWVFGAYELVRVINDINKKRNLLEEKVKKKLKEVLTIFTKIRTPLAKLQKPGEQRLFSQIATKSLFKKDKGLGWHIYDGRIGTIIFRSDLSDKLLELLKLIHKDFVTKCPLHDK